MGREGAAALRGRRGSPAESSDGRDAALSARLECERGRRLDRALHDAVDGLEARERAFAHELAYGVSRMRARLDHLLAAHVHRGLDTVDPVVLELLRAGAYQLLYMGGVPAYAAVSATVDRVRDDAGDRPAGFVNAVLRKVAAEGAGLERFPDPEEEPAAFLASWGSHPEWLVRRWLERWDVGEVRALVEADNERPATHLVPLDGDAARAVAILARAGIEATPVGVGTACVRLADRGAVRAALEALPDAIVQDPGANLVTRYADVPRGTIVADLCAAPGGKALALTGRPVEILAADRSEPRMRMLKENADRTGRRLVPIVADALHPPIRRADVVMLDAPCTGTGTLSRHPDARWRLRPESVTEMATLQRGMLEASASVVAADGLLVYSTCTLEPEENRGVVDAFLSAHQDFEIAATDAVSGALLDERGCLHVLPQRMGCDGSFAARMRRVAA